MGRNKEEKKHIVYLLRCTATGKEYVGQSTRGARYRRTVHKSYRAACLRLAEEHGTRNFDELREIVGRRISMPFLTGAFLEYPNESDWEFEVLHELSNDLEFEEARNQLTVIEKREIKNRNTLYPNGLNANLGFNISDRAREHNRVFQTGKPKPESQKEKMRESHLARWARRRAEALKAGLTEPM